MWPNPQSCVIVLQFQLQYYRNKMDLISLKPCLNLCSQTWLKSNRSLVNIFIQNQSPGCSMKKGVLKNFPKFTGKHLCQSLFFNKVAGLRPATLLKRDSGADVFLWILRNFYEHFFYRTRRMTAYVYSKWVINLENFSLNSFHKVQRYITKNIIITIFTNAWV